MKSERLIHFACEKKVMAKNIPLRALRIYQRKSECTLASFRSSLMIKLKNP